MIDSNRWHDASLAIAVGVLLGLVYLCSFSGQFRSIDEYAMYARTESLAQGYGLRTPQLAFSARHHPVGALEPGQPLLAVPFYLLALHIGTASNIAGVMLFNVCTTALTGVLLYVLLRHLHVEPPIAALSALAWGIGTTAWPYARSFFREPLLGLLWVGAAYAFAAWHTARRPLWGLACVALACAGVAVKIASASALPVFLLGLLWDASRRRFALTWRRALVLACLGLAGAAAAALFYTLRYDKPFPLGDYLWDYPWKRAAGVAYGLLASPVKGVLFYSPILVAEAVGWPRLFKRHEIMAFLIIGLTATLLYVYGSAEQWHGGNVVWGPRFMVPLLPFLMIPYAFALMDRRPISRVWVLLWTLVGLVIQIPAGIASWADAVWQFVPAYRDGLLVGLDGIPWYSWRLLPRSPALVQLMGWHPRQMDLIWLRALADGSWGKDGLLGLILIGLLGLGLALMILLLTKRPSLKFQKGAAVAFVLAWSLATGALLVRSGRDTPDHHGLTRAEGHAIAAHLSDFRDPYTVVLISNDFFIHWMLGLLKGSFLPQWYSPYDPVQLASIMNYAPKAEKIWLIVDHVHRPPDADPYLVYHHLVQEAYLVEGRWIGGYEVFEFLPPALIVRHEISAQWEPGMALLSVGVDQQRIAAGETLRVDLEFSALRPVNEDYTLFVHLVAPDGTVLAAPDGPPYYGAAPTSSWEPGESLVEHRGVRLPETSPPGIYRLMCGWLGPNGTRIPLVQGSVVGSDTALLGTIEVLPKAVPEK